jgi:hypothetical protein
MKEDIKHAKIDVPKDNKIRAKLYKEALLNSYQFWVDELNCSKSFSRQRDDKSFNEVFTTCSKARSSHWTIMFRDNIIESDKSHYEFGVSTIGGITNFIWILVRVDLAEKIFKKYKLKIQWY